MTHTYNWRVFFLLSKCMKKYIFGGCIHKGVTLPSVQCAVCSVCHTIGNVLYCMAVRPSWPHARLPDSHLKVSEIILFSHTSILMCDLSVGMDPSHKSGTICFSQWCTSVSEVQRLYSVGERTECSVLWFVQLPEWIVIEWFIVNRVTLTNTASGHCACLQNQ